MLTTANQEQIAKYSQAITTLRKLNSSNALKIGATPTNTIYSEDKIRLLHYATAEKKQVKTPLLIVYALVNRHHIADLDKKRSMVAKLIDQGIDLYVIDWGYPDPADRFLDLEDYIQVYIDNCVNQLMKHSQADQINLLGICQGGTLSCCYTALHTEKIKNLITMVAPFDFDSKSNTLANMARTIDFNQVCATIGNIKGEWLNKNFNSLNPISLNFTKYINAIDSLQDETTAAFFLRMENWIQDSPDQAATALCEFVEKFYQQNMLVKGKMTIGKEKVDTKKITQPILNVYGSLDHIVPAEASKALKQICSNSTDYSELVQKTGHIGMYVSSKAKEIPIKLYEWLKAHD